MNKHLQIAALTRSQKQIRLNPSCCELDGRNRVRRFMPHVSVGPSGVASWFLKATDSPANRMNAASMSVNHSLHHSLSTKRGRITARCFRLWTAAVLCTSAVGCLTPMNTRFPVLQSFHPRAEAQAFQQSDPFMDPDIGPGDESRPRDFARPRTESRRAAEQRLLQGGPISPETQPPGYPRGGLRHSGAL